MGNLPFTARTARGQHACMHIGRNGDGICLVSCCYFRPRCNPECSLSLYLSPSLMFEPSINIWVCHFLLYCFSDYSLLAVYSWSLELIQASPFCQSIRNYLELEEKISQQWLVLPLTVQQQKHRCRSRKVGTCCLNRVGEARGEAMLEETLWQIYTILHYSQNLVKLANNSRGLIPLNSDTADKGNIKHVLEAGSRK